MNWLESFLFGTVWGIALLVAPFFAIAWIFHKILKGSYAPYYIAGGLAFLIFLTAPSIPRFLFEKRILEQTNDIPGLRLVKKMTLASLAEPITWFHAPYGHFWFVRPESAFDTITGDTRTFRVFISRYEEETMLYITEVFCDRGEYFMAAPAEDGVFRFLSEKPQKLSSEEKAVYCGRDWITAQDELRKAFLEKNQ